MAPWARPLVLHWQGESPCWSSAAHAPLGLATPVAIMVGNGMGAKNGIMFKTAVSLEEAGKMQIVALDKTGTITNGEPKVTDVLAAEGFTEGRTAAACLCSGEKKRASSRKSILERAEEGN